MAYLKNRYPHTYFQAFFMCLRKKINSQGGLLQKMKYPFTLRIDVLPQAIVFPICIVLFSCSPPSDREGSLLTYAKEFDLLKKADGKNVVVDSIGRVHRFNPLKSPPFKEGENYVARPLNRVIVLTTPMAAYMRKLETLPSIVGVTTKTSQWYIPHVKSGLLDGSITQLGQNTSFDIEAIIALKPDMVFASKGAHLKGFEKLAALNIPHAYVHEYLESHPMGQAEWIKFFGAFFDQDEKAIRLFDQTEKNTHLVLEKISKQKTKPRVLWGNVYKGRTFVPGGDSFVANLISHAGGTYAFADLKGTGAIQITMEAFYAGGKDADIYIVSSTLNYTPSINALINRAMIYSELKPIRKGKVWCYQPWYWQSKDKMDEIIHDIAAIFHPGLFSDYDLKHFIKLKNKEH